jgi:regulator of replication initiation timing
LHQTKLTEHLKQENITLTSRVEELETRMDELHKQVLQLVDINARLTAENDFLKMEVDKDGYRIG